MLYLPVSLTKQSYINTKNINQERLFTFCRKVGKTFFLIGTHVVPRNQTFKMAVNAFDANNSTRCRRVLVVSELVKTGSIVTIHVRIHRMT